MASCETRICELLREIEPTETQKEGAKRSHNYLREILITGNMASRITDSYLSGSYARDTAIRPLDDVDIIFIIDKSQWHTDYLSKLFDTKPSPDAVLKTFKNAIRYRYNDSSLRAQNRSVRLQLNHLNIDVVPAIESEGNQSIMIPDRSADKWIITAPAQHSDIATSINRKRNGLFKPLVKLLKFWNTNLPTTANLKSFCIETMAARIFQNANYSSFEEGILKYFDFIAAINDKPSVYKWSSSYEISFGWFNCSVPDLANTGSNTAVNVDSERMKKFSEHAIRGRDRILEAGEKDSLDKAWKLFASVLKI